MRSSGYPQQSSNDPWPARICCGRTGNLGVDILQSFLSARFRRKSEALISIVPSCESFAGNPSRLAPNSQFYDSPHATCICDGESAVADGCGRGHSPPERRRTSRQWILYTSSTRMRRASSIVTMSCLGHQFIAAEGGIGSLASAVPIAQPAYFISRQALGFSWAHVSTHIETERGKRGRRTGSMQTGSAEYQATFAELQIRAGDLLAIFQLACHSPFVGLELALLHFLFKNPAVIFFEPLEQRLPYVGGHR